MPLLKSIWKGKAKHKKLCDELDLAANQDSDGDGDDFCLPIRPRSYKAKYLGHGPAYIGNDNKERTSWAVNSIVAMSKLNKEQIKKVFIKVTFKGIEVVDRTSEKIVLDISILRICNFYADAKSRTTIAFLATNDQESTECHAFVCSKRSEAEKITESMVQAFKATYRMWQDSQDGLYTSSWTPTQSEKESRFIRRTAYTENERKGNRLSKEALSSISNRKWISFDGSLEDVSDAGTRLLTFAEVSDMPPPAYVEQPQLPTSHVWNQYQTDYEMNF